MRPSLAVISVVFIALTEAQALKRETGDSLEKKVVCYYTNWSVYRPGTAKFNPQNINPYLCTHLIYAFGGLDRENGLRPYDKYQDIEQGGYAKFTGLKTYNKALKTLLAIGGWNEGSARFSPLVADEERRREFVRNVVKFLRQNHFDGLDLDWEYPAFRDGGKSKDRDNYAQLVQELREEFDKESSKTGRSRLLLTMAVPAGLEYIDKGYDIPKLNRYLDFMNILSYDYHSAYEPSVNHHSPLYSLEEENEYNFDAQLTIDGTVKHFLLKGADPEKLVLGIPTYGRSYTLFNPDSPELGSPSDGPGEQGDATREKGYLAYYEICDNVKGGWTVVQPKETAMGPYAYKENQWVGYDDEAIVRKKSQYVNEKNLGGIMFWSIDNDDFRGKCGSRPYPLIEAAKEALLGKSDPGNKISGGSWVRGGKTGGVTGGSSRTKVTSTPAPPPLSLTTPDPPTTPDPGSDFVCKDEGFFPHPRDCKKYFWCLDSGPSNLGIVAHQFTCPSGLFFNKAADSCDFSRNVICKKSSSKTTTTTSGTTTTSAPSSSSTTSGYSYSTALKNFKSGGGGRVTLPPRTTSFYRSTTSRSTTTTEAPLEEEEEEEYEGQAEDPQTIKQLIHLIKKLGGVAELEKQLEGSSGGVDSTTPAISKSLYQRVLSSGSPRYQTIQRNGPSGPQNEGLPREPGSTYRQRDKPQYVTIRRERPSSTTEAQEEEYSEDEEVAEGKPTGQRKSGGVERTEPKDRPKYQPVERFRGKHRGENREEEGAPPAAERGVTTPKYTSILRSRSPTPESSATTSKYVILQRQRPQKPAGEDVGTTENELTDEDETTVEHSGGDTTTARPSRVKVSETSTIQVPTSTSVITEIVEGATRRQRVPLSKLKLFLKGGINSLETPVDVEATKTSAETSTTFERPLVHGFNRRRPEVVVTSATQRTAPAFLSGRRSRFRSTTTTSTESSAEETVSTAKGRFAPSRGRYRSTTPQDDTPLSSTTEYPGYISANRFRNRFVNRRSTTEKSTDFTEEEDELFVKGNSRESTVIRKPVYRGRFPSRRRTTATSVETSEIPSSTTEITSEVSLTSPSEKDGEVSITQSSVLNITTTPDVANVTDNSPSEATSPKSDDQIVTTTLPLSLPLVLTTITTNTPLEKQTTQNTRNKSEDNVVRFHRGRNFLSRNNNTLLSDDIVRTKSSEPNGRQKIILRRKKPTNPTTTYRSVDTALEEGVKNKMKIVVRRRKPVLKSHANVVSEEDIKTRKVENRQRGRVKFVDIIKKDLSSSEDNSVVETKQSHSIPKSTITSPTTISPRNKHRRLSIRRNKLPQNTEVQGKTDESSKEDLPGNYGEKSRGNNGEVSRNKARKVLLKRKTLKDLAVGESGTGELEKEGWDEGVVRKRKNSGPSDDLESHSSEDFVQESRSIAEQQEVQARTRRPFRRTSSRTTTTSTTEEPVTTGRARTTVQSLKQRLNRFKSERGYQGRNWGNQTQNIHTTGGRNSDQGDVEVGSTQRPRRVEFRRLIRPVVDDSQLDASDVTKSSRPRNDVRTVLRRKPVTQPTPPEGAFQDRDEDVLGSRQEQATEGSHVSVEYEDPQTLPDLANVAVAAIQSLATPPATAPPPPPATPKYKPVKVRQRPASSRHPFQNRATTPLPPSRSSPRPFSRIKDYQEYEDYDDQEPVDVPLSGKVRIHNDGFIECLDIGNFPHPFSCRKFISCAKMENSHLLGWEYTCPKGLSFDPIGGICNWNAGLGCKE